MPKKSSTAIIELTTKGEKKADIVEDVDHDKEKEKVNVDTTCEETPSQQQEAGDAPPKCGDESLDLTSVKDSKSKVCASTLDDSVSKPKKTKKNKKMSAKSKKSSTGKQTQIDIAADESQSADFKDDPTYAPKLETPKRRSFFNLGKKSTTKTPQPKDDSISDQSEARTSKSKSSVKNRLLTDFFPVRRSDRRSKADLEKIEAQQLEEKILSGCEDGLKVVDIEGKGRGVIATKLFKRGEFIVEYAGDLITLTEAQAKEDHYSLNSDIGCYMYYFKYNNKNYCVDATAESGKLGRLLNHSKNGNCKTKVVGVGSQPYLILIAAKDIRKNEELSYDYGDRSKEALEAHPWLAK